MLFNRYFSCLLVAYFLCGAQVSNAQDTPEIGEATHEEWFSRQKAELVYGLQYASFSALYITENQWWFFDEISEKLLCIDTLGILKNSWRIRHDTGPFSDDILTRYDDNTLHYGTLFGNFLGRRKKYYEIQTDARPRIQEKNSPLNPKTGAVALNSAQLRRFGAYDLVYNLTNGQKGAWASLYARKGNGKNILLHRVENSSGGNISTSSNFSVLAMQVVGNRLVVLDNVRDVLLVFDETLQKRAEISVYALCQIPEKTAKRLTLSTPFRFRHLLYDEKTTALYLFDASQRPNVIYRLAPSLAEAERVVSAGNAFNCFQIYNHHAYFLLPGERIERSEHLQKNLYFQGRYNYAYRLALYPD